MTSYRYTLETGSRRHTCPQCNQRNKFKKYIDSDSGSYVADIVGRCDRENNCGYHMRPKEYFEKYGIQTDQRKGTTQVNSQSNSFSYLKPPKRPESGSFGYIDTNLFRNSLKQYNSNNLYLFLLRCFGDNLADYICARYLLGTSKYIDGSCVFWYIDYTGKVTDGKIMYYDDPKTGKRYKGDNLNKSAVNWVHTVMKLRDFKKKPCFYGEHLLKTEPVKPVLIVESEKTALIASVFFYDSIVLATGGEGISDRFYWELFQGRQVTLIPDTAKDDKAFKTWQDKAKIFNKQFRLNIRVSNYLNNIADETTNKQNGDDLADFLTRDRDTATGLILFNKYPVTWEYLINGNEIEKYNDKPEDYQSEG